MWDKGTITLSNDNGKNCTFQYWVKYYEKGSKFGIKGGKVSKLMLKYNGEVVYSYDRGLDTPPVNKIVEVALEKLLAKYN